MYWIRPYHSNRQGRGDTDDGENFASCKRREQSWEVEQRYQSVISASRISLSLSYMLNITWWIDSGRAQESTVQTSSMTCVIIWERKIEGGKSGIVPLMILRKGPMGGGPFGTQPQVYAHSKRGRSIIWVRVLLQGFGAFGCDVLIRRVEREDGKRGRPLGVLAPGYQLQVEAGHKSQPGPLPRYISLPWHDYPLIPRFDIQHQLRRAVKA